MEIVGIKLILQEILALLWITVSLLVYQHNSIISYICFACGVIVLLKQVFETIYILLKR